MIILYNLLIDKVIDLKESDEHRIRLSGEKRQGIDQAQNVGDYGRECKHNVIMINSK